MSDDRTPALFFPPCFIKEAVAVGALRKPTDEERKRWPNVSAVGAEECPGVPVFATVPLVSGF